MIYSLTEKKIKELVGDVKNIRAKLLEPKIFEKLPEAAKVDLLYKPKKRIKREIIEEINKKLPKTMIIAGSFRRGADFSRDIDIVSQRPFAELSKYLEILEPFVSGETISRTLVKWRGNYYKLDYFQCSAETFPGFLLYATGSKDFNILMRQKARKKGFLLNQNGLYKGKKLVAVKSEADIFELLDMKYQKPEKRNFEFKKKKLNIN